METKDIITLVISSLAFIVAVLSYLNTARQRRVDNERTLRYALTEVIADLVQVDWDRVELDRENVGSKDDKVVTMRRILNNKKSYLARQGDFLVQQMATLTTDTDFNSLARAFADMGDYAKARGYWDRCVQQSSTPIIRAMNLRGFAAFLFRMGDFDTGRRVYRESLEVQLSDNDEMRRLRADTYAMWMRSERDYGFSEECARLRQSALSFAKRIGASKVREEFIEYVDSLYEPLLPRDA
jgi:tetratricopeptide (TPR) repeat protein